MLIEAAVASGPHAPLEFQLVELDEPRDDEVRIRFVASGVCHTDAAVRDGVIPTPLPAVLGHEGAGVIEAVGPSVRGLRAGDHVVLSANSCGRCDQCLLGRLAYCENLFAHNFAARRLDGTTSLSTPDGPVGSHFFGQSSFAAFSNVAERSVVKVSAAADLTVLAPLGCGVQTGAGAILNELRPGPGASVVVFGTGAVGTAAIMASRLTGATTIVAVDLVEGRLELAREIGATHTLNGRDPDIAIRLREITKGRGVDFALDTTGVPAVLRTAADALAVRGTVALVGSSHSGTEARFEIGDSLNKGWSFKTIIQGSSVPQVFIPALVSLWEQGRFPFDRIVTRYPAHEINEAFEDSERGTAIKPVIVY
ncbi:NAD(P)-dependent alcohol dehydrogenase [Microbacterium lacticum]|uniref:NAD(P)-dependent alcohol dehydrogenase n=1 Tax=Microbacterium lacticum TaxID=33885 RepID=UPI003A8AA8B9